MLTLTRREGESIVIGDNVRVTVKEVRGRHVKLMIGAPSGIPIYREEIYKAIEEENRAAVKQARAVNLKVGGASIKLGASVKDGKGKP